MCSIFSLTQKESSIEVAYELSNMFLFIYPVWIGFFYYLIKYSVLWVWYIVKGIGLRGRSCKIVLAKW